MTEDTQRINDIITRWKGRQSILAMARELGIGRTKIAGIISQHQEATQSTDTSLPPTSLGKAPLARASKLDPYREQLLHLLERYPRITAQRALEELRNLGFEGKYTILRSSIQYHAYGFHSLERILAHFGSPRNSWESLTEHVQQMLKQITESDPIGPRRSEEFDAASGGEPPRQDPAAPGGPVGRSIHRRKDKPK